MPVIYTSIIIILIIIILFVNEQNRTQNVLIIRNLYTYMMMSQESTSKKLENELYNLWAFFLLSQFGFTIFKTQNYVLF